MLAGRDGHVLPLGAGFGAGGAGGRVNLHPPHARRPQQHRAFERLERRGAVAGALRGDPHPLRGGELHRAGHVGGGLGEHNGGRPLVGEEVPRLAGVVVAVLARDENVAGDRGPQRLGDVAGKGVWRGHCFLQVNGAEGSRFAGFALRRAEHGHPCPVRRGWSWSVIASPSSSCREGWGRVYQGDSASGQWIGAAVRVADGGVGAAKPAGRMRLAWPGAAGSAGRIRWSWPRELMPSLVKTLCRWYLSMRGLMNSRAPISGSDRPSLASRATWASWAVSASLARRRGRPGRRACGRSRRWPADDAGRGSSRWQFWVIDELTVRFARSQDHSDHALLLSPWPESLLALRTDLGAAGPPAGVRPFPVPWRASVPVAINWPFAPSPW